MSRHTHLARLRAAATAGVVALLVATMLPTAADAGLPTPWPSTVYASIPALPSGVVVDNAGNLCIGSGRNETLLPNASLRAHPALNTNLIWNVDTSQNVTVFPTFQQFLASVFGEAVGPDGNLYVTDQANNSVDRITPSGVVTVVASGFNGQPFDLAFNPAGDLYVSLLGNYGSPMRPATALGSHIPPGNQIVNVTMGGAINQIPALFNEGPAFAFDLSGHLVVLAANHAQFDSFTTAGANATLVNSQPVTNVFTFPTSMAIGGSGNYYVGDWGGFIQEFAPNGHFVRYVLPVTSFRPNGLAFSSTGTLFATDGYFHQVYAFSGLESSWGGFLNHTFACGEVAPTAPLRLKVTRHGGTVTGTWLPQPGNWFLCTLVASGRATGVTSRVTLPTCTFRGLNAGGSYAIRVEAINAAGVSPIAQASAPTPVPIQITCKRGSATKKVTGFAPLCPIGWHRV